MHVSYKQLRSSWSLPILRIITCSTARSVNARRDLEGPPPPRNNRWCLNTYIANCNLSEGCFNQTSTQAEVVFHLCEAFLLNWTYMILVHKHKHMHVREGVCVSIFLSRPCNGGVLLSTIITRPKATSLGQGHLPRPNIITRPKATSLASAPRFLCHHQPSNRQLFVAHVGMSRQLGANHHRSSKSMWTILGLLSR